MKKTKVNRYKYKWGGIAGRVLGAGAGAIVGNPMVGMQLGGMAGDAIDTASAKANQPKTPLDRYTSANQGFKYGGKYQNGGAMPISKPLARGAQKYDGPQHEQGGIPIDSNGNPTNSANATAEVEGGETEQGGYIFSNSLKVPTTDMTFAQAHEMMLNKGASEEEIQKLAQLQEQQQQIEGKPGGDEGTQKFGAGGFNPPKPLGVDKLKNAFNPPAETEETTNPLAPNKTMIAVNRFLPSAMKLGMAAFAPRNDQSTPKINPREVPVTSPVFNEAKTRSSRAYRAGVSNPNASPNQRLAMQSQYLQNQSQIAGQEADYRNRQEQLNAQRGLQAQTVNAQLSQADRDVKAREDAARMKLVQDAVQMPVSMYRADQASKRQAIAEIMTSADRISEPTDRDRAIRQRLRAIGLEDTQIEAVLRSYKNQAITKPTVEKKTQ